MLFLTRNINPANDNNAANKSITEPFFKPVASEAHFQNPVSSTSPFFIQRTPQSPATSSSTASTAATQKPPVRKIPSASITRAEFETYVKNNYAVADIHTGTKQEQEKRVAPAKAGIASVPIANWQSWDPGSASIDYTSIIKGIEDMIKTIGAIPSIRSIVFFLTDYDIDSKGGAVALPGTGADFSGGVLTIYSAFSGLHHFPTAAVKAGKPAIFEKETRELNIKENIVHELGHGVAEAAMASQNRKTFEMYQPAVGWVESPVKLYDVGKKEVTEAIAGKKPLPSQFEITPDNWNTAVITEQPMSRYSVLGGPSEDFAESIAAYIYQPAALKERSPKRFEFIENNMGTWKSQMQVIP